MRHTTTTGTGTTLDGRTTTPAPRARGRMPLRRGAAIGGALTVLLLVTGCVGTTPTPAPSPSIGALIEALCDDDRVAACELSPGSYLVTAAPDLTDADTLDVARLLHEAAAEAPPEYGAHLQRTAPGATPADPDMSAPTAWSVEAYPVDPAATLSEVLGLARIDGALEITAVAGWPHVSVAGIERFRDVFDTASAWPLFAAGGTFRLLSAEDRLRIVHTPAWTSTALAHELIAISAEYPEAEVLLEAEPSGAIPPAVYISRLTPEQVDAVSARLSALVGVTPTGAEVPFTLGVLGADGVTYTTGTVGVAGP